MTVEVNQQKPHLCAAAASSTHHQLGPGDGRIFSDSCLIGRFGCAGDGGGGEGEHQRGPHSDQPSTFLFFFFCFRNVLPSCERLLRPSGPLGLFLRLGGTTTRLWQGSRSHLCWTFPAVSCCYFTNKPYLGIKSAFCRWLGNSFLLESFRKKTICNFFSQPPWFNIL